MALRTVATLAMADSMEVTWAFIVSFSAEVQVTVAEEIFRAKVVILVLCGFWLVIFTTRKSDVKLSQEEKEFTYSAVRW